MNNVPNLYEVSGTRAQAGAIGSPENFRETVLAENARAAYMDILNRPGYERINVVAIKIECPNCAGFHLTLPVEYYIGV